MIVGALTAGLLIPDIKGVREAGVDSEEHGEQDSRVDVHSTPTAVAHEVDGAATGGSEPRATGTAEDVGKTGPNGPSCNHLSISEK